MVSRNSEAAGEIICAKSARLHVLRSRLSRTAAREAVRARSHSERRGSRSNSATKLTIQTYQKAGACRVTGSGGRTGRVWMDCPCGCRCRRGTQIFKVPNRRSAGLLGRAGPVPPGRSRDGGSGAGGEGRGGAAGKSEPGGSTRMCPAGPSRLQCERAPGRAREDRGPGEWPGGPGCSWVFLIRSVGRSRFTGPRARWA